MQTGRDQPVELVLHDSVSEEVVNLGGKPFPLAGDLTTPLIRRLTQHSMQNYEYCGVLDTSSYLAIQRYALDPYQPGKIPFVLVEGLWSSPVHWIRMLDHLRADPRLARLISSGLFYTLRVIHFQSPLCRSADPFARFVADSILKEPIPLLIKWSFWKKYRGTDIPNAGPVKPR